MLGIVYYHHSLHLTVHPHSKQFAAMWDHRKSMTVSNFKHQWAK